GFNRPVNREPAYTGEPILSRLPGPTKPARAAELFAVIKRVVSVHGGPRATPSEPRGLQELLDPAALLACCGDDEESLRDLCQAFGASAPPRIAEVRDAFEAGDAPRLREAAHRLCGLLSAFSTAAGAAAAEFEAAARSRIDQAPPWWTGLRGRRKSS